MGGKEDEWKGGAVRDNYGWQGRMREKGKERETWRKGWVIGEEGRVGEGGIE